MLPHDPRQLLYVFRAFGGLPMLIQLLFQLLLVLLVYYSHSFNLLTLGVNVLDRPQNDLICI